MIDFLIFAGATLGCLVGIALGLVGLIVPATAARIVRLIADPAFPDGVAEFRGTFGGLFVGVHGFALALLAASFLGHGTEGPAVYACGSAASVWLGTAVGRGIALLVDRRARSSYQVSATVFEAVLGVLLAGPTLIYFELV